MRRLAVFVAAAGLAGAVALSVFFGMRLIGIDDDVKAVVKAAARKVKAAVYREATIHNPSGDMVPDWIDDVVLGKIREIF